MNWITETKPVKPDKQEEDSLELTPESLINMNYTYGYRSLSIHPYYATRCKLDAADKEGTRAAVLRELLPLAEAAVEALRQAVAKLDNQE